MLSLIHPGWLLFFICSIFLILLVGCVTVPTRTPIPSATHYPLVTLTTVPFATETPQPRSTRPATETIPQLPTPSWMPTRTSATGASADDPICYQRPNQGYMCLGRVWNQTADTLTNISVQVSLFQNNGQLLAEQTIGVEQRYLPPESFAPYRALFDRVAGETKTAHAQVNQARVATAPSLPVHIVEERGVLASSGRYVVTANLRNSPERLAKHIRLIVTLLDTEDHVIGYRIHSVAETMTADTQQAVRVEVIPQVMRDEMRHELQLEAWIPPESEAIDD